MNKQGGFWNSVRDFWKKGKTGVALFIHSTLVLIHTYFAYENQTTWKGYESFQNVFVDISRFIPVALAYTGIIIGGIDVIMLLSDWYANRKQRQIKAAEKRRETEVINALTDIASASKGEITVGQAIEKYKAKNGNTESGNTPAS